MNMLRTVMLRSLAVVDEPEHDNLRAALRRVCTSCGAVVDGPKCWLCGSPSAESGVLADRHASATAPARGPQTFGLSSLFLFVTLTAICLGVLVAVPGLGIVLAVISVPAFVRASASAARERAAGHTAEPADKIRFFLTSIGLVVVIAVAGFAAFFAACLVACPIAISTESEALLVFFMFVAGIIAISVMGWLFYKTWPKLRR
jgi:hypothetical protein